MDTSREDYPGKRDGTEAVTTTRPQIPIVSVVGRAGSGKTTFIVKLVAVLRERGYRVATIKHSAERLEIDRPGKDTWRHAEAGAETVLLVSGYKLAMFKKVPREPGLDELAAWLLPETDIVITEGFKKEGKPKIEVVRKEAGGRPVYPAGELLAVVGDVGTSAAVPHFGLDDAPGVADLLERRYASAMADRPRESG